MLEKWDIHTPKTNNSMHSLLHVLEITERFIDLHVRPKIRKVFPCGSAGKESACNAGDLGSIPELGKSPEEGKGPLRYSGLENSKDHTVCGVAKSRTRLSDFHFQSKEDSRGKTWEEAL